MPNEMDWDARFARAPGLEINEVTDGFLVYQRDRDRVHFLNATATLVLESCDGRLTAAELPLRCGVRVLYASDHRCYVPARSADARGFGCGEEYSPPRMIRVC